MKNKLVISCILLASVIALGGCGKSKAEDAPAVSESQTEEQTEEETTEVTEEEEAVPGKVQVVDPLPSTTSMDQLDDCTVAVSVEPGGLSTNDAGEQMMKVTVFTYDQYDMVDISQLKAGDTIAIRQEPVIIASLEQDGSDIVINGGIDEGGYVLRTSDSTTYYEISYSDMLSYYEIGQITLPVSPDFVYTDSSDLDNGPATYTFTDLLEENVDYFFVPHNTKIVIEGGMVVSMERVYIP